MKASGLDGTQQEPQQEKLKMFNLVMAVWYIIVGVWIIFSDGRGWCIACRDGILTVMGVICIILGVIAIINRARSTGTTVR